MTPALPRRIAGFLLLPVTLLLAVIGAVSFVLVQDIGTAARPAGRETERARLLAEAALAHATWKLNQVTGCTGYGGITTTTLGTDQYQVSVSPASGSPVTLTATATLASGLSGSKATVSRKVPKTSGSQLTYTIQPVGTGIDTYLDSDNTSKNYGSSDSLLLKQGADYPLLRFDLSTMPAGSRIVDAKMTLYRTDPGSFTISPRTVEVYRLLEPWVAGTKNGSSTADGATWNTRNGTIAWKSTAGTIEATSALDVPHTHFYIWSSTVDWNITSLVQGWVDGRYPNYGLMLRPTTSVSTETYAASDSGDSVQSPKLVIKYIAPCGAVNPPQDGIGSRIAWWKFNETSGSTAADAVGTHAGTLNGGSWSASGGVSGGALNFASAGKVTVAAATDLSRTDEFTLAAWINMSDRNGKRPVMYKSTVANEANYAFGTRDGELYFEYFANNAWQTFTTSGLNLRPGTYYHIAATFKNSTNQIKLYLDGSVVGTVTTTATNGTPSTNNRGLMIGATPYNESFLGRLDDVQFIGAALDAAGVATIMGGIVRKPSADTRISGDVLLQANNYGATTPVLVQFLPKNRTLLRFDVSAYPAGTAIKRATLSFHVENPLILSLGLAAQLYPVKEAWVEGTQNGATSTAGATWVKRQVGPDLPWSTAGGTYDSTLAGTLSLPVGAATQRYWEVDITSTVQEWVDGIRPNYGLILLMSLGLDSATISSKESLRQEPRLVVSTQ